MIRTTDVNDRIFPAGADQILSFQELTAGFDKNFWKYLKPDSVDARPVVAR
jgi:hypothetical protein